MNSSKFKIGISLRVTEAHEYQEKRDSISHDWSRFLEKIGAIPILIPNTTNVKVFLDNLEVDGLVLSGGDNIGDNPERDKTERELLEYGLEHNIPIFGVCRGMQFINEYFGGSKIKTSDRKHVGKSHLIDITNTNLTHGNKEKTVVVNSYHNNIITNDILSKNFEPIAISKDDSTIEAIKHKEYLITGVMWHPEREQNEFNTLILKNALQK